MTASSFKRRENVYAQRACKEDIRCSGTGRRQARSYRSPLAERIKKGTGEARRLDAGDRPSPDLRKWFAHDRKKYEAFCRRYLDELRTQPECAKAVCRLRKWVETEPVTLLYAARDTACNHARVVRHLLLDDVETLLEEARIRSLHENRE